MSIFGPNFVETENPFRPVTSYDLRALIGCWLFRCVEKFSSSPNAFVRAGFGTLFGIYLPCGRRQRGFGRRQPLAENCIRGRVKKIRRKSHQTAEFANRTSPVTTGANFLFCFCSLFERIFTFSGFWPDSSPTRGTQEIGSRARQHDMTFPAKISVSFDSLLPELNR
jgi:hypothetical protein